MLNNESADDFYKKFFQGSIQQATNYKYNYLKSIINSDTIYKFIQFDNNPKSNENKFSSLECETLRFSHHRFLNDPTEYEIAYDVKTVSKKTGIPISNIKYCFGTLQDLYEVCCFTYEYNNHMWNTYSNNGNGLCIEFNVGKYDLLYPVIYKEKGTINFTEMIVKSFFNIKSAPNKFFDHFDPMAILPFIVKNPINGELDSRREKEIRMLYAPTDKSEFNNGILYPNAKEDLNFNGINVTYSDLQLSIKSITIGKQCHPEIIKQIERICDQKKYNVKHQQ